MIYIIDPTQGEITAQLGGKGKALATLHQCGLQIPAWFVLSPTAFYDSLNEVQRHALATTTLRAEVLAWLIDLKPNPAVRAELSQALASLCPQGEWVAVRSSALSEDGAQHSFAGQLDSFLNVSPDAVADNVAAVWRSAFSERILAYRRRLGLRLIPQAPAVLIQRMVNASVSGIAFSADPVTGRRHVAVVSGVCGLGTALVSGKVDAETYYVDRRGQIVERLGATKQRPDQRECDRSWWEGNDDENGGDTPQAPRPAALFTQECDSPWREGNDDENGGDTPQAPRPAALFTQEKRQRSNGEFRKMGPEAMPNVVSGAAQGWTGSPSLRDSQIQAVADLVRRTEQIFGHPQDIEWAIEEGRLFLLQSRPITTLAHLPDPESGRNLWDNSNIAESYPGVTTPLTFSFARRAYEEVYRQFCQLMGVPKGMIMEADMTFKSMLGLIQGRIYYNLLSWYRVLAMLPGYKVNRRFMEQMMGIKEGLPDDLLDELSPPTPGARMQDGLRLGRTLIGLIINFLGLSRRINAFYLRLNLALGSDRPDFRGFAVDELVIYYRDLERQLLTRWDAPLVNDFFAMIFYGLLRKLTEKWCGDPKGTLQNNLLTEGGGMISTEPVTRIRQMAQLAATDPAFVIRLNEGSLVEILETMGQIPRFEAQYYTYLDKFGERCLEELKLESPTLHDDPLILLRAVGQLARLTLAPNLSPSTGEGDIRTTRVQAAEAVHKALIRHPVRRVIFYWVLRKTRTFLRNRENLRFERTRLFGRARMIFNEFGRRFRTLNLLADPGDIFYLEVEEVLGVVKGTTTTADLRGLVALRRTEFEHYRAIEAPPDHFETVGIPGQRLMLQVTGKAQKPKSGPSEGEGLNIQDLRSLQGLGCCPGVVRGRVRLVSDPKVAGLQSGEILVAKRTDPGWILLFPIAAGLLVEHGSLLSHSAIVSREMGLPAIVSLPGITGWLKDGDWVEFDGTTGVVTKIG